MEDIPQPSRSPYERGDVVRVYVADSDPDARYNGEVCCVVDRFEDDLGGETGRDLDAFTYRLESESDGSVLDVDFRHQDLVPADS